MEGVVSTPGTPATGAFSERVGAAFAGRRVLVTGHTGFKGSWLALWLTDLGAQVTGLALERLPTRPSHFELVRLDELVADRRGDVRRLADVHDAFVASRPEIVFHLAAQALVRPSYADPKATLDTNIGGTVNVLEAVRTSATVRACVVVTSDKCYENRERAQGYREDEAMGGHDPYSASKGACELVCAAYRRSFFARAGLGPHRGLATARSGNVIAGGDWGAERLIPDCVRAWSAEEPVRIRHPQATRPWMHALDPLAGYLTLAAYLTEAAERFAGPWNFGPDEPEWTVDRVARAAGERWGGGRALIEASNEPLHEATLLRLDATKAAERLGWAPVWDTERAIAETMRWYRAWHEGGGDLRALSRAQIAAHTVDRDRRAVAMDGS